MELELRYLGDHLPSLSYYGLSVMFIVRRR